MKKNLKIDIIGVPNTGKSTFINSILREKISITSNKPQTTEIESLGIMNINENQLIFSDTPGINFIRKSEEILNKNKVAFNKLKSNKSLYIYFFSVDKISHSLLSLSRKTSNNICIINKVDKTKKNKLLTITDTLKEYFDEIFYISALKNENIDLVREYLNKK